MPQSKAHVFDMPQTEVERIVSTIQSVNFDFWVDGGWGVDALVGRQTRQHKDLDICIRLADAARIKKVLGSIGYVIDKNESPTRLIMCDDNHHRMDLHLLSFDENGDGIQNYIGGAHIYPAADLESKGQIGNLEVSCLSAQLQIKFRKLYESDEKSAHDIKVLEPRA